MEICQFCKGELEDGARKCRHCGEWVRDDDARRARGDLPVAVQVAAVAVMLFLAWLFIRAYIGG